jgi:hypothetical protein
MATKLDHEGKKEKFSLFSELLLKLFGENGYLFKYNME